MSLEYRVGDVWDRLKEIPDGTIDLLCTSPPFLALRSYLPADHPDKAKEIGSEPTPAAFIDTLLALTAEFGRVLAPHGSICVELGDTFSGSSGDNWHKSVKVRNGRNGPDSAPAKVDWSSGWPLAKSLTGIPQSYMLSLVYGWNVLDRHRHGPASPAGRWRVRNQIVWARPNPPVGALGDKFRPATSYITVACRSPKRFFDLDAVRTEPRREDNGNLPVAGGFNAITGSRSDDGQRYYSDGNPAGAPPLDWHTDQHPEDGDWLWKLPTQPYKGSHYATFPLELPTRLIKAMCPLRVCVECGKPSERITDIAYEPHGVRNPNEPRLLGADALVNGSAQGMEHGRATKNVTTVGWSDCGHDAWRTGVTLDPFAGSGTTLEAAQNVGRHAIGIDLDPRNADLARSRCGMFMEVDA